MKTLTYTESRHINNRELVFIRSLKPATLLRCFQHFIETSDWDEQIIRREPLFNKICLVTVILSGLAISPFLIAAVLK